MSSAQKNIAIPSNKTTNSQRYMTVYHGFPLGRTTSTVATRHAHCCDFCISMGPGNLRPSETMSLSVWKQKKKKK